MVHSDDEDDTPPAPYEGRMGNGRIDERDEDIVLLGGADRMMTASSSGGSLRNSYLSPNAPSTAFTSPDPSYFATPKEQTQQTQFIPIAPLEDLDNEGGGYLAKVAEPDQDSFMQYAALVPEYCRLEGLVVRGAV
jgi:xylulokinase